MAEDAVPICRLCLEVVYDGRFQEAESIIIILQNVLPDLNFSVSSHPLVCRKCAETLQKSFNFKSACLETEKQILNYRPTGSSTVYLEEVAHIKCTENEVKMEKIDKGKICRFCLQILEGELCTQLGVLEKDMLQKCLPELDLTVSENPVICEKCLECLHGQFNFVMSCSDIEMRIQNYCSMQGTNSSGQVNLQDIIVGSLKTLEDKNRFVDVKAESEDNSSNVEQSEMESEEVFIKDEISAESAQEDDLDTCCSSTKNFTEDLQIKFFKDSVDSYHDPHPHYVPSDSKHISLLTARLSSETDFDAVITDENQLINNNRRLCNEHIEERHQKLTEDEKEKLNGKIKRQPETWKMNINKEKCQSGKEYKGQERSLKAFKNCGIKCKYLCAKKISLQERELMFNVFSALSKDSKLHYLAKNTERVDETEKETPNKNSRCQYSFKYYFHIANEKIRVCKTFFLSTLNVSSIRYFHEKKMNQVTGIPSACKRGPPINKKYPRLYINRFQGWTPKKNISVPL